MLHYIKTNMWDMIKNEKWFTFTIILTQAISVVVALFSSGMIYNFTIKEKAMEGTMLMIHMGKSEGNITDVKAKEIKESFPEVYELLGNKIESIDYVFLYEDTTGAKTDIASKYIL